MHTLAQLCVRRPVFATMLILSLVVVGIFSYFSLGVDLFPKVDIPTVVVIIANPGASPEEIETEISKKVESAEIRTRRPASVSAPTAAVADPKPLIVEVVERKASVAPPALIGEPSDVLRQRRAR